MLAIRKSRLANSQRITTLLSRSCLRVGAQHNGDDTLYHSQIKKKETNNNFNKADIIRIENAI
jgi:hypothetical protein